MTISHEMFKPIIVFIIKPFRQQPIEGAEATEPPSFSYAATVREGDWDHIEGIISGKSGIPASRLVVHSSEHSLDPAHSVLNSSTWSDYAPGFFDQDQSELGRCLFNREDVEFRGLTHKQRPIVYVSARGADFPFLDSWAVESCSVVLVLFCFHVMQVRWGSDTALQVLHLERYVRSQCLIRAPTVIRSYNACAVQCVRF